MMKKENVYKYCRGLSLLMSRYISNDKEDKKRRYAPKYN
jgi:hypothetical protein